MCRRCQNETLPRLKLPSWQRDVLRKAAAGMIVAVDPRVERIKARKAAKGIRTAIAARDWGSIKLILTSLRAPAAETPSEECDTCLKLQARAG